MDKIKVYCNHCYKEGVETELGSVTDELVQLCPKHDKLRGNFYTLVWN